MQRDNAYRLTSQTIPGILDLGYTGYDANGNLNTRTDSYSGSAGFAYDALNRLDTGSGAFGSRDYDYDLNGNRTRLDDGSTITYDPSTGRYITADPLGLLGGTIVILRG